jgi:uncharacterized membrane protein
MMPTADDHDFNQLFGECINDTLALAALLDGVDEQTAVFALAAAITELGPPRKALATAVAGLAVRLHRTSALQR